MCNGLARKLGAGLERMTVVGRGLLVYGLTALAIRWEMIRVRSKPFQVL